MAAIDVGYDASGAPFTTAPATPSNANGTQIVTAGWANDRYLAIAGGKMTGQLQLDTGAAVIYSIQNVSTADTTPSGSIFNSYSVYSKDGVRIGFLQMATRNSGSREWNLVARSINSTSAEGLTVGDDASNNFRTKLTVQNVEESDGLSLATTTFARENGGSYWGLGTYAPSVNTREDWSTLSDVDKTGFYSVGNSTGQKVVGTVLHIQRQWEAGANSFQLNFGADNAIWVRSRDTSYTAEWNSWVQIADREWVLSHLSSAIPPGAVMFFAQGSLPDGWLICNGANVSRTTYANLFAAIGTKYGSGNGSTTFTLPNLNSKFVEGTTTTSSVGQTVSAGLPNITGGKIPISSIGTSSSDWFYGAIYPISGTDVAGNFDTNGAHCDAAFDASKSSSIYGGAATGRPIVAVHQVLVLDTRKQANCGRLDSRRSAVNRRRARGIKF